LSIFEIIMLICFGAAWPLSIYKSYKSKSTQGKSAAFLVVILIGYAAGILNKFYYNFDNVVYLYALNMVMVALDLVLYVRNQRLIEK
jgi:PQ loop repeat